MYLYPLKFYILKRNFLDSIRLCAEDIFFNADLVRTLRPVERKYAGGGGGGGGGGRRRGVEDRRLRVVTLFDISLALLARPRRLTPLSVVKFLSTLYIGIFCVFET